MIFAEFETVLDLETDFHVVYWKTGIESNIKPPRQFDTAKRISILKKQNLNGLAAMLVKVEINYQSHKGCTNPF